MIQGKSVLGIISARGGSKRVPGKNVKMLAGKPLIAWTIIEAKKSKYVDQLFLTSDDEEIIATARQYGCEAPFIRPKELARDDTPGIDPVLHLLQAIPKKYDLMVLLQPTSPLREANDIDQCIEKCVNLHAPTCVSLGPLDKHPTWMFEINKESQLVSLFPETSNVKGTAAKGYALNGAVYVAQVDWILQAKTFISPKTVGFPMSRENSVDIDTEIDFEFAEILLSKRIGRQ